MSKWPTTPLRGHVIEVSIRKGETPAEILSVTNTDGLARSLDVFDKQVFSQDASNYKLVRFNELAYNPSRINVGSVARCEFPQGGAVSPMYVVVRCHDTLLPQFLLYFLKSDIGTQNIARRCEGAVRFMLRFSDLEKIEITLPPVAEQRRLISLLDDAASLLWLRKTADERCQAAVPALFEKMFFGEATFERTPLSELCEFITKGSTPAASEINERREEGDVPFLKVLHITDGGGIDFAKSFSFVSPHLHNGLLRRSKVYPGDVLMNIVGPPLGKIGLVPEDYAEWNVNQALAVFRPRAQILSGYLLHALRSPRALPGIIRMAAGVRQLNLSLEQCRKIEIPVPPLPLQREFVRYVAEIRELGGAQAASGQGLNDLFHSLLHRAFRGEL